LGWENGYFFNEFDRLFGCRLDPTMLETLFGVLPAAKKDSTAKNVAAQKKPEAVTILDARKAHNFAIQLRALGMRSIEVCEALLEGKAYTEHVQCFFVDARSCQSCDTSSIKVSFIHPYGFGLNILMQLPNADMAC
jgi:hypothetical protein